MRREVFLPRFEHNLRADAEGTCTRFEASTLGTGTDHNEANVRYRMGDLGEHLEQKREIFLFRKTTRGEEHGRELRVALMEIERRRHCLEARDIDKNGEHVHPIPNRWSNAQHRGMHTLRDDPDTVSAR